MSALTLSSKVFGSSGYATLLGRVQFSSSRRDRSWAWLVPKVAQLDRGLHEEGNVEKVRVTSWDSGYQDMSDQEKVHAQFSLLYICRWNGTMDSIMIRIMETVVHYCGMPFSLC